MKNHAIILSAALAMSAAPTFANEIPDLQSSIANLSEAELTTFESQITDTAITETLDIAVETAIETGGAEIPAGLAPELSAGLVSEALSEGFITESEAADLTNTIEIYEANAEHFDFDFLATMQAAVEAGGLTAAEASQMMNAFNRLSDTAKSAVGSESFNFDANHADMTALSEADRRIICSVDCANNPY